MDDPLAAWAERDAMVGALGLLPKRQGAVLVPPLLCPNGGVNVLAWRHYSSGFVGAKPRTASQTMALGRNPATNQVIQAMCRDYANIYGT